MQNEAEAPEYLVRPPPGLGVLRACGRETAGAIGGGDLAGSLGFSLTHWRMKLTDIKRAGWICVMTTLLQNE